ncbi:hypothetical protein [Paraburkholderia antibiotica]|uniref:Uncharacterized protein n=1 Tax=Paraburkholderia antibiotica TaxID=2728839 RepID=A0A7X9X765_9BURK|nr:hypothetical protein [Paraburkholderia antibiotica]NML32344.1 hypothetical protein [Paraburkholderia antibiotica]
MFALARHFSHNLYDTTISMPGALWMIPSAAIPWLICYALIARTQRSASSRRKVCFANVVAIAAFCAIFVLTFGIRDFVSFGDQDLPNLFPVRLAVAVSISFMSSLIAQTWLERRCHPG